MHAAWGMALVFEILMLSLPTGNDTRHFRAAPTVPAVAAGGWAAAHKLVDFRRQCEVLDKVVAR